MLFKKCAITFVHEPGIVEEVGRRAVLDGDRPHTLRSLVTVVNTKVKKTFF